MNQFIKLNDYIFNREEIVSISLYTYKEGFGVSLEKCDRKTLIVTTTEGVFYPTYPFELSDEDMEEMLNILNN